MRKCIIPFLGVLGLYHSTFGGFLDFFGMCSNPCSNCKKDTNLMVSKLDRFREELKTAKANVTFNSTKQFIGNFSSETSGDNAIKFCWKMHIEEPDEKNRCEKIIKMMLPTDPEYKISDFKGLGACDLDLEFQVPLKKFFACLPEEGSHFYVVLPRTGSFTTDFQINLSGFCFIHRTHDQALFLKNLCDFATHASKEVQEHFTYVRPGSSSKDAKDKKRALESWLYRFFMDFVPSTYITGVVVSEGI